LWITQGELDILVLLVWIKSHKEVLGRAHKGFRMSIFVGETSTLQRREGEKLLYYPPKTSHWKLASRNQNIQFWKPEYPEFEI
jgi:hypothetical protein